MTSRPTLIPPSQKSNAKPSTWTLDPLHSTVEFSVKHLMIATVSGRFTSFRATIDVAGDDPTTAKVAAEIDTASIETGAAQRDAHLRSADFFDAEHHPTLRFESTGGQIHDGETATLVGNLTMRGVTREVPLTVTFDGETRDPWGKRRAAFTATAAIDRSAWGLTWNQALETGGVVVSDKVKLNLHVVFIEGA
ncbi:MAG: YceI family protein [Thermoplasmatota archaeon]